MSTQVNPSDSPTDLTPDKKSSSASEKKTERLSTQPLVKEMEDSYLEYAMSVIVSRALPDVRDGLKPVHRRVLYAMWTLGLKSGARFRKSATVVGEVLGKYHPHGDVAVYDSLVRLAQDFSIRYPLINGQGNFGSIDGDGAAAMRYTESKLMAIAEELLFDLDKDAVDFHPNYDESQKEPRPLPAKLPNLLLNGSVGIAVGMATSIPPHNLGELVDAIIYLIKNPEATVDELMKIVPGPDFPTGGIIYNQTEIKRAYATGKGRVVTRGKAVIETDAKDYSQIIISEIPYLVNKANMVAKIAELVKDKKINDIRGLRDESDRQGMRVVVELKKDAYPQKVLNQLYKQTQLQQTFHVNMLALVNGIQPQVITLKTALTEYLKHRQDVIRRRTQFDLTKAEKREHIVQGLQTALDLIDKIIKLIKGSQDRADAKSQLMDKFKFSELQTEAILDMKLSQLANLERLKVEQELKELRALIKKLRGILADPKQVLAIIEKEVTYLKDKYADPRRTKVVKKSLTNFSVEDLIPDEPTMVVITRDGYIKRLSPDTFKVQHRGGKGVVGLTTKETDQVEKILATNTHADILFFTTRGRVFQLKAHQIPVASRLAKGQALVNFLKINNLEKVSTVWSMDELESYKYLLMVTSQGVVKKVDVSLFANVRTAGLNVVKLKEDDVLGWVKPTTGQDTVVLVTAQGQSIHFKESDVRPMGRQAGGVRGIRLKDQDRVVGAAVSVAASGKKDSADKPQYLAIVSQKGYGKKTNLQQYKIQTRGGSGIKTAKITTKTGALVWGQLVTNSKDKDLVIMSQQGQVIRLPLKSIPALQRSTQGVKVMRFKKAADEVVTTTLVEVKLEAEALASSS